VNKNVIACMIVKNCEDTILATLNFLDNYFEKVVIVYDDSVDNTGDILERYRNRFRIVYNKFVDFSQQWSFCIKLANEMDEDYLLKIDSDEVYTYTKFDKLASLMKLNDIKGLFFSRYNLQNDFNHYKKTGFPDSQIRLVHKSVRMNGKPVDEGFVLDGKIMGYSGCNIVHFGHVRNEKNLIQKSEDRQIFADVDNCDGENMKKHKHWFLYRNELWKDDVEALPEDIKNVVEEYKGFVK